MDTYYDSPSRTDEAVSLFPSWSGLGLGVILTFLLIYVGIARPVTQELSQLRQQVSHLQSDLAELTAHSEAAQQSASLLSSLLRQNESLATARRAVQDLRNLQQQIVVESRQTADALAAVARLAAIKDSLLANADQVAEAANVLAVSELILDRLTNAADHSYEALEVGNNLLALSDELLSRGQQIDSANGVLQALIQMGNTLHSESAHLGVARDRVADLLNLKDAIVSQTDDLADAIVTLELSADLRAQFEQAQRSFAEMRHWLVEVVATEPLLQRARYALEPITDLVNLRRMKPEELREMARAISEQFQTRVALRAASNEFPRPAAVEAGVDGDLLEEFVTPRQ